MAINIGMMNRYCEFIKRIETVEANGSRTNGGDDPKGFAWGRVIPWKAESMKITGGLADYSKQRWLFRYNEILEYEIQPGFYFKSDGQYYKIDAMSEAVEYGFKRAVYLDTSIMNRQFIRK